MSKNIDASKIQDIIRDNGIPPRPVALEAVHDALRQESADLRRLEGVLISDVAISAGLMKLANSPFFGAQRRVRSVMEAVEVIGLNGAARAVACISLKNAFPNMNLERFWDSSAKIAQIAGWLVRKLRPKGIRSEDAYTFGMFRDCGIAILLQRMPAYAEVLRQANQETVRPFAEIETEVLPVGHAQIGAMMTQTWWLPDELIEAVRHHHEAGAIDPAVGHTLLNSASAYLIATVQFAEYLFQETTGLCATREWEKLGTACLGQLQIGEEVVLEIKDEAAEFAASIIH